MPASYSDWITEEKKNACTNYTFVKIYLYPFRENKEKEIIENNSVFPFFMRVKW